ncbi:hypothetical protein BCT86_00080 [Vibrio breoganii]|uniref:glycosyltransferase n=1 Tax=Vibrio breoganii TaxID=553239 RepID=UPI000C84CB1E|nr:glycosyltransferase [Vibrio breoganii]PML10612.1 hypothetical protein BCT86_00080 [Vibrio breoganii]
MKICLVIPSFYPAVIFGGPIFSTYHTCTELAKIDDIKLNVITTDCNMHDKLDVKSNAWIELNNFHVKYYSETILGKFSLRLATKLWRDITGTDVVHVQAIFNSSTPIALFYGSLFRKSILLSPRGALGEWCLINGSKYKLLWLRLLIKPFLNRITWHATSYQEKNEILKIFPSVEVEVVPNGIDYENFQVQNKLTRIDFLKKFSGSEVDSSPDKIIISMGRLQKKKGFDILIESFSEVLKLHPSAKLLIAGDDEGELTSLTELASTLGIINSVYFTGNISGQDKVDFLANADLFVLPSHNENFGNVYVESLAAGTPVVASLDTPWSEVEIENCGRWVKNTVSDTVCAMLDLLSRDRESLRENSKKCALKYDWSNIAASFKNVYSKMVG